MNLPDTLSSQKIFPEPYLLVQCPRWSNFRKWLDKQGKVDFEPIGSTVLDLFTRSKVVDTGEI